MWILPPTLLLEFTPTLAKNGCENGESDTRLDSPYKVEPPPQVLPLVPPPPGPTAMGLPGEVFWDFIINFKD